MRPADTRATWDAAFAKVQSETARDAEINVRYAAAQADGTLTAPFEQEWSDSVEPLLDAQWALFRLPAPDLRALEWKLIFIAESELPLERGLSAVILADVHRFLPEEAAA